MQHTSLLEIYHRMCARREAINRHYVHNTVLKISDPISYEKYRRELRDINKRLRIIRQCIPSDSSLML